MQTNRITHEHLLFWLAFLLALCLRLFQLGAAPLSDVDAGWSLPALNSVHASGAALGAQPAYILLTSLLFSIFSDTNFMARLFPALAGSLIVWLPYLFRRWMGDSNWLHLAGVVMAFGLALDPALVSLSRQVGSPMPAVAFTVLALGSVYNRRMVWTGIFTGLALLAGPVFMQGLLILGVTWGLYRLIGRKSGKSQPETGGSESRPAILTPPSIRIGILAFGMPLLF